VFLFPASALRNQLPLLARRGNRHTELVLAARDQLYQIVIAKWSTKKVFLPLTAKKKGRIAPAFFPVRLKAKGSLRCHMDQGAGVGIFQQPQRAIGTFCHIADALSHSPALCGFRAALPIKDDAGERLGSHAAYKTTAVPLREGLRAAVEHQIA